MTLSDNHYSAGPGSSDDLTGLQVLLVEDSGIVGTAIKDFLQLLGADVVGPATTTAEAERLLSEQAPDAALVDLHLRGGELSHGLIARLHEQGMHVIVISGSSESLSPLPLEAAIILEKAFQRSTASRELAPVACQKEPRRGGDLLEWQPK
jgi:CheY-like chemotaxis protein